MHRDDARALVILNAPLKLHLANLGYLVSFRRGHYQRALEEAIQTHQSQWPKAWQGKNPLANGGSYMTMTPEERVSNTAMEIGFHSIYSSRLTRPS